METKHELLLKQTIGFIDELEQLKSDKFHITLDDLVHDLLEPENEVGERVDTACQLKWSMELLLELFLNQKTRELIPVDVLSKVGPMLPRLLNFFTELFKDDMLEQMDYYHIRQYGMDYDDLEYKNNALNEKIGEIKAINNFKNKRNSAA